MNCSNCGMMGGMVLGAIVVAIIVLLIVCAAIYWSVRLAMRHEQQRSGTRDSSGLPRRQGE
jgi:uncharacterized membrane protein